ncbi:glycine N-acyltransferase-like protein 3 isoform X2 [Cololabis saira]|uniref:glycine N-acyltransferase-like protein 3 isoform X2 n=1 Tax=Cololabis saira TaxID=129043 RepID=UPI002AD256D1|nr:glycine N-acyltransferase-like protein 3 isoform X2 [Cololabis saira]
MKVLNKDELQIAEGILQTHLPKSYKVYGFLYGINRNKESTLQVVVDSWPGFKVIICRPDPKDLTFLMHRCSKKCLQKDKSTTEALHWCISCICQISATCFHHLLTDLVNKTWKFGGDEKGYWNIKNLISNFPSCCITDIQGQLVAWMLVYNYCALGMLYTLPEHRGKGYAKVLISTMAKKLLSEGYPVYCFIEEENKVSYSLFKTLGFIEDESYRAAWFEFNF